MSYGIFLPILAYLNQIEPWWFVLKNGMKRWDELERFRDGVDAAFNNLLMYLRGAIPDVSRHSTAAGSVAIESR